MLVLAKDGEAPVSAAGPDAIASLLASRDWSKETVVAHNAQFDTAVMSFRYGIVPGFVIDTLSMARAVLGLNADLSLAGLAERFGLAAKTVPYDDVFGLRFDEMSLELVERLRLGCEQDVILVREIFKRLAPGFPKSEFVAIEATMKMFINPTIIGDAERLKQVYDDECQRKEKLVIGFGVSDLLDRALTDEERRKVKPKNELAAATSIFRSSPKFKALLESHGIVVGTKENPKGELIPATDAKSEFMRDLMARDDIVGDLANAKIDIGSSINETRAKGLLSKAIAGPMSIQLKYFGTMTARWAGGGDKLNYQNLPRDNKLRNCLLASTGLTIVDIDFEQIEFRVLCAFAEQWDKLNELAAGRDIYAEHATKYFGVLVTRDDMSPENRRRRQLGKESILSCQYMVGKDGKRFQETCRSKGLKITIEEAIKAVALYRETFTSVVKFWDTCSAVLYALAAGKPMQVGPVLIEDGDIVLPNSLRLHNDIVAFKSDRFEGAEWKRKQRQKDGTIGFSNIHAGVMTENLASSVSRVLMSDALFNIHELLGLYPFLTVHDSLAYLIPSADVARLVPVMIEIAQANPPWWREGCPPIAVEAKIGARYGSLKKFEL